MGGDHIKCRGEGGGGLQGERESDSVMVRHSERGNRKSADLVTKISVRARKWRVCMEAYAEMVSTFLTANV